MDPHRRKKIRMLRQPTHGTQSSCKNVIFNHSDSTEDHNAITTVYGSLSCGMQEGQKVTVHELSNGGTSQQDVLSFHSQKTRRRVLVFHRTYIQHFRPGRNCGSSLLQDVAQSMTITILDFEGLFSLATIPVLRSIVECSESYKMNSYRSRSI